MFGFLESDTLGTILKCKLLISPCGCSDQQVRMSAVEEEDDQLTAGKQSVVSEMQSRSI